MSEVVADLDNYFEESYSGTVVADLMRYFEEMIPFVEEDHFLVAAAAFRANFELVAAAGSLFCLEED